MRNIKFRGKTKETGKWVDGSYVYAHKWFGSGKAGHFIYDIYGDERVLIDENTLGQFTGFFDKNHKEIYDGDILKYISFVEFKTFFLTVMWSDDYSAFVAKNDNEFYLLSDLVSSDCEIAGNIYENPELLEEV